MSFSFGKDLKEALLRDQLELIQGLIDGEFCPSEKELIYIAKVSLKNSSLRAIKFILERGIRLDNLGNKDDLLFDAVTSRKVKIVELLLKHGADVQARRKDAIGFSPIHIAALNADIPMIECLLGSQADKEQVDNLGRRPLHLLTQAVECESIQSVQKCIRYLLELGAAIDVQDDRGFTALHYALISGNNVLIQQLLEASANIDITLSPKIGPPRDTFLHYSVNDSNIKFIERSLNAGANSRCTGENEYAPIHIAFMKKNQRVIDVLLKYGADPDQKASEGVQPIHCIALNRCYYFVETNIKSCLDSLLSHGVDINTQDDYGNTTAHFAADRKQDTIMKCLLDRGADIGIKANDGCTPFMRASSNNDEGKNLIMIHGGIPIDENDLQSFKSDIESDIGHIGRVFNHNLKDYERKLEEEVARMKSQIVHDSVSLYDVFVGRAESHKEDGTLIPGLKLINFKDFPEYEELIMRRLEINGLKHKSTVADPFEQSQMTAPLNE